jgi:hypothetical protein
MVPALIILFVLLIILLEGGGSKSTRCCSGCRGGAGVDRAKFIVNAFLLLRRVKRLHVTLGGVVLVPVL